MDEKLDEMNLESRSPLTEHQLQQLEALIRCPLPSAYRRFLGKYGAVSFPEVYYRDPRATDPILFGWFLDAPELISYMTSFSGAVPASMIAIGEDECGNLYCLGTRGPDRGKLFFRIHDIGLTDVDANDGSEGTPDQWAVYQISPSFEDFIESLIVCDE